MTADAGRLAGLAAEEAERHPPRTPERRAAAALFTALITTRTVSEARRSLDGFTMPETAEAALELLGRLITDVPAGNPAGGAAPTEGRQP